VFSRSDQARPAVQLEIDIEGWSSTTDWADLAWRVLEVAEEAEPLLANQRLSASLLFTVDEEVRTLNREWRSKDKATNVLSFPMMSRSELAGLAPDGGPEMLGDIALAWETCAREAGEKGVSVAHHAAHLILHGLLHLAGHDHVENEAEAEAMERLEVAALAKLGIADPYGER
jgi:probable rRNA maturation factor